MNNINEWEYEIQGKWENINDKLVEDDNCCRIRSLIKNRLVKICSDSSGWDVLYKDPADGRYWELIYQNSEMSGGGPPTLRHLSKTDANAKYCIDEN